MRPILVVLACCLVLGGLAGIFLVAVKVRPVPSEALLKQWGSFKRDFGKNYQTPEEDAERLENFRRRLAMIESHNRMGSLHKLGLNEMADWTRDELYKFMRPTEEGKYHPEPTPPSSPEVRSFLQELLKGPGQVPDSLDWREFPDRVALEVGHQRSCGGCWAFAAAALLEGQQVVRNFTKKLVPLSKQQLLDCSKENAGCMGGWTDMALSDVKRLGGIQSEQDYAFETKNDTCRFERSKSVMSCDGSFVFTEKEEGVIKEVLAKYGPIVATFASTNNWLFYKSGILTDDSCASVELNHSVLLVGYGTDPKHGDYWLVKNSWGPKWGEQGYFRIRRGSNMCQLGEEIILAKFAGQSAR